MTKSGYHPCSWGVIVSFCYVDICCLSLLSMMANSCLIIVHTVASSLERSPCLSINMPDQFHNARLKVRKVFDINGVPAHSDREVSVDHSAAWVSHVLSDDTRTIKSYEAPRRCAPA